jgi:hypothetical protein
MALAPRTWGPRLEVRTRWVPPEEALRGRTRRRQAPRRGSPVRTRGRDRRSRMPLYKHRPAMRLSSGATTAALAAALAVVGAAADRDRVVPSQTRRAAASATRSVARAPRGHARAMGLRRPSLHSRAARPAPPRPSSFSRRAAFRSNGGAGRIRLNSMSGVATVSGVLSPSAMTACVTEGATDCHRSGRGSIQFGAVANPCFGLQIKLAAVIHDNL